MEQQAERILEGIARNSNDIKEMSTAIANSMNSVAHSVETSIGKLVTKIDEQNTMLLDKASNRIPIKLFIFVTVALVGMFTAALKVVAPHLQLPSSVSAQDNSSE